MERKRKGKGSELNGLKVEEGKREKNRQEGECSFIQEFIFAGVRAGSGVTCF